MTFAGPKIGRPLPFGHKLFWRTEDFTEGVRLDAPLFPISSYRSQAVKAIRETEMSSALGHALISNHASPFPSPRNPHSTSFSFINNIFRHISLTLVRFSGAPHDSLLFSNRDTVATAKPCGEIGNMCHIGVHGPPSLATKTP